MRPGPPQTAPHYCPGSGSRRTPLRPPPRAPARRCLPRAARLAPAPSSFPSAAHPAPGLAAPAGCLPHPSPALARSPPPQPVSVGALRVSSAMPPPPRPSPAPGPRLPFQSDLTFPLLSGLRACVQCKQDSPGRLLLAGPSPRGPTGSCLSPRATASIFSFHLHPFLPPLAFSFLFLSIALRVSLPHLEKLEFLKTRRGPGIAFEKAEAQHCMALHRAAFALISFLPWPHPFALASLPAFL